LDAERMAEAAKCFEGEHDFTSLAAAAGRAEDGENTQCGDAGEEPRQRRVESAMVRRVFSSRILRRARPPLLIYEVCGNGFLHHMVRNMVGTLVEVGRGKLEPCGIRRILEARDRTQAGPTAPARGLCLVKVEY
jgi:tRNA pseudouridine38-40 synthase